MYCNFLLDYIGWPKKKYNFLKNHQNLIISLILKISFCAFVSRIQLILDILHSLEISLNSWEFLLLQATWFWSILRNHRKLLSIWILTAKYHSNCLPTSLTKLFYHAKLESSYEIARNSLLAKNGIFCEILLLKTCFFMP